MKKQYGKGTLVIVAIISVVITLIISILLGSLLLNRLLSQKQMEEYSVQEKMEEARTYIDRYFVGEIEEEEIENSIMSGLIDGLHDQWSYYMSAEEFQTYQENMSNSYVGIGVTAQQSETGLLEIVEVNPTGGAAEAGLTIGDSIEAVEGKSVQDISFQEAIALIKGEEGTKVTITVIKPSGEKKDYSIERRTIQLQSVKHEMIDGIGYIRIENFDQGTSDLFVSAVDELVQDGAEGLIFDLRYNPGGQLNELTVMLDKILPECPIFVSRSVEQREKGEEDIIYAKEGEVDLPMVCLIGEYTYSAAEFFPAVLQEYGKATLVGTSTTGKGYAQVPFQLSDGSAIVISVREYFTPNGVSLAEQGGIDPDVEVEMTIEQLQQFQYSHEDDPVLDKALEVIRNNLENAA